MPDRLQRRSQNALRVKDFRPLLGFPVLRGSYSSDELFPLFAQRAMNPRRPDYQRYVERLGLEGEPGPWVQLPLPRPSAG